MFRRAVSITNAYLRAFMALLLGWVFVATLLGVFSGETLDKLTWLWNGLLLAAGLAVVFIIPTITGLLIIGSRVPYLRVAVSPIGVFVKAWAWCLFYGFCVGILHTEQNPLGLVIVATAITILSLLFASSASWSKATRAVISLVVLVQILRMVNFQQDIARPAKVGWERFWTGDNPKKIKHNHDVWTLVQQVARQKTRDNDEGWLADAKTAIKSGQPVPPRPTPIPESREGEQAPTGKMPRRIEYGGMIYDISAGTDSMGWYRVTFKVRTGLKSVITWRNGSRTANWWDEENGRRIEPETITISWVSHEELWRGSSKNWGAVTIYP